jgi:TP901 family phage tail tape measure protein
MPPTYKVAEAYARLYWKDAEYYKGLNRAKLALSQFQTMAQTAFGPQQTARLTASGIAARNASRYFDGLANSVRSVTGAVRAMNRAFTAAGIAPQMTRAMGANQAAAVRATATALATQQRAQAAAQASIIRAQGSAAAQMQRALGPSLNRRILSSLGSLSSGLGGLISRFSSRLLSAASMFARRARGLLGMPLQLAGLGGGIGAGIGIFAAGRESVDFEARMATLRRITGGTAPEIDRLTEAMKQLGSHSAAVGMHDLMEIAEIGARMGVPTGELGMFTNQVGRLSAVLDQTELPIREAAGGIGSLLTIFNKGFDDAERFGSMLVKLDQISVATARDVLDVTGRMGPAARMFGMQPWETMGLAAAMRQARIPTETAGTAFGQIMMRMASRRDIGAFAKVAGMKRGGFEQMLDTRPFEALQKVMAGLAGPRAIAASRILDDLHLDGQRVRQTMGLLGKVLPLVGEYTAAAAREWETLDSVEKGYAITSKTTAAQLTLMVNNLRTMAIETGTALLPALKGFSAGIVNLSTDVRAYLRSNAPALTAWGEELAQKLTYLGTIMRTFPDHLELLNITFREKLMQMGEIAIRSIGPLGEVLGALGLAAGKAFGQGIMDGFGGILANNQIGRAFADMIDAANRAMAAAIGGNSVFVQQLRTSNLGGILRAQAANAPARPKPGAGLMGVFQNLPNLAAEKAPIVANIAAAAAQQGQQRKGEQLIMSLPERMARVQRVFAPMQQGAQAIAAARAGIDRKLPMFPGMTGPMRQIQERRRSLMARRVMPGAGAGMFGGIAPMAANLMGGAAGLFGIGGMGALAPVAGAPGGAGFGGRGGARPLDATFGAGRAPIGFEGGGRGFGAGAASRMGGAAGAEFNRRMAAGMTRSEFFGLGARARGGGGGFAVGRGPQEAVTDPVEDVAKNTEPVPGLLKDILAALGGGVAVGGGGAGTGGGRPAVLG